MSGKNNVNPDHYTIGGRDRPNETIPPGKRPPGESDDDDRRRWDEREKEKKDRKERSPEG
jgi:hypothetical protein